jgi:hypothetical protein
MDAPFRCERGVFFLRTVRDLEIFSIGEWTDSQGFTDTYSSDDLARMVANFNARRPEYLPVKLGHTSPEFNHDVAKELGLPESLIHGENGLDGVASLGEIVGLRSDGSKLYADLHVQDPLAGLIERGFLRQVSSEMSETDSGWAITGLALLGAERPAVKDLEGLAAAAVYRQAMKPAHAFAAPWPAKVHIGRASMFERVKAKLGLKADASEEDMLARVSKFAEDEKKEPPPFEKEDEDEKDMEEGEGADMIVRDVRVLLGLSDAATGEEIVSALRQAMGLPDSNQELPPEAMGMLKEKLTEGRKYTEAQGEIRKLTDRIASLEKTNRKAHWTAQVSDLKAIAGTPGELADKLVRIEEKIGLDFAESQLAEWKATDEQLQSAGVLKAAGSAGDRSNAEPPHPFEEKIRTYMSENKATRQVALARLALDPSTEGEFTKWRRETNDGVKVG